MSEMSRQQRWRLKKLAAGLCGHCGEPRQHYATECDACRAKHRGAERAQHGYRPQTVSGIGRPVIYDGGEEPACHDKSTANA